MSVMFSYDISLKQSDYPDSVTTDQSPIDMNAVPFNGKQHSVSINGLQLGTER